MSNLTTSTSGNQTLILDPNLCTLQTCDLSLASFSYIPNLAANALYLAIFAILFFVQLGLGIRYQVWGFMGAMLLGLVCTLAFSTQPKKIADWSTRHSKSLDMWDASSFMSIPSTTTPSSSTSSA